MLQAEAILHFLSHLKIESTLPPGVGILNPYVDDSVFDLCKQFYSKFYHDQESRTLILGINPGRFGGGVTGIPFTDPVKLQNLCGIQNLLPKRTELSADFIYSMIAGFGGPEKFYRRFYFNAVSPLGFTKDGKNLNYYDLQALEKALKPFITQSIDQMLQMNIDRNICYCIGEGENYKYLSALNKENAWFQRIITLPHPRFIMQYRRKKVGEYIDHYLQKLSVS